MNNVKNHNNNCIKGYFAFVLMFFAVFSGNNITAIFDASEGGYSIIYTIKPVKAAHYNECMQKLSLAGSKSKSSIFNYEKDSLLSFNLDNIAVVLVYAIMALVLLFIYYCNNCLVKNNIWLRAVY